MTNSRLRPPAELAHIADAIGAKATLWLVEEHGGTEIYVPHDPNQGSRLALCIGLDAAKKLAAVRGGEGLRVPLARAWRIHVYADRGDKRSAIARRMGMTESGIWRVLRGVAQCSTDPNPYATQIQRDLFGG
ncbi:hypothetical protein ACQW02_19845 [Humitalea sp. 24SJ18S-53]|uniref:hypothetical protein n=1 Tax=Humitalea sp. 24SJ18S-53 TaxID=3422307 RepID=UPI003D66EDC4